MSIICNRTVEATKIWGFDEMKEILELGVSAECKLDMLMSIVYQAEDHIKELGAENYGRTY